VGATLTVFWEVKPLFWMSASKLCRGREREREEKKRSICCESEGSSGGCGIEGRGGKAEDGGCCRQTYAPPNHRHEVLELTGPGAQWDLHQFFPR